MVKSKKSTLTAEILKNIEVNMNQKIVKCIACGSIFFIVGSSVPSVFRNCKDHWNCMPEHVEIQTYNPYGISSGSANLSATYTATTTTLPPKPPAVIDLSDFSVCPQCDEQAWDDGRICHSCGAKDI